MSKKVKKLLFALLLVALACVAIYASTTQQNDASSTPDKKEVALNAEEAAQLELSFLKAKSASQELTLLQLQFERKQKELEALQQQWSRSFDSICAKKGLKVEGAELSQDFKKITGQPVEEKKESPPEEVIVKP